MRAKLLVAAILAGFAFAPPAAHAESAIVEAINGSGVVPKPTTQVAYPPKCHAYPVPRYCRRW